MRQNYPPPIQNKDLVAYRRTEVVSERTWSDRPATDNQAYSDTDNRSACSHRCVDKVVDWAGIRRNLTAHQRYVLDYTSLQGALYSPSIRLSVCLSVRVRSWPDIV